MILRFPRPSMKRTMPPFDPATTITRDFAPAELAVLYRPTKDGAIEYDPIQGYGSDLGGPIFFQHEGEAYVSVSITCAYPRRIPWTPTLQATIEAAIPGYAAFYDDFNWPIDAVLRKRWIPKVPADLFASI